MHAFPDFSNEEKEWFDTSNSALAWNRGLEVFFSSLDWLQPPYLQFVFT